MKILLTNHELNFPGGSETACYTLAAELIRLGHDVTYFGKNKGLVARKLESIGAAPLLIHGNQMFDLALCSHIQAGKIGWESVDCKKIIRICHGTTPKLEQPEPGADAYVAISEEVQSHLKDLGHESTIIRNGIDCERFKSNALINPRIKNVLGITASREARKVIHEACKLAGAKATFINKVNNPRWDTENAINEADLVISLGRGALEAMACERPVIVWDWRSYNGNKGDGLIAGDVHYYARFNFSGRFMHAPFDADGISKLIERARDIGVDTGAIREWVIENANIRKTAQQYLSL